MCGARPCKKYRFDTLFTVFRAHWPFEKKLEKIKNEHIFRHFSGKGSRHPFFIDFGWILGPFWEDFGVQDRKKEGSKKRVKNRLGQTFRENWELGVPALKKHPGGGRTRTRTQGEVGRGLEGLDI